MVLFLFCFFLIIRRSPGSTRTDSLFPYTTLFRSLLSRLARSLGSGNIDFRLRYNDAAFDAALPGVPWFGMSIEAFSQLDRSEEHTSELQSLMRISYAAFCLNKIRKRRSDTGSAINTNASAF